MANISGIIKERSENSLLFFTRYIFKESFGVKFEVAQFHKTLANVLEKVHKGEIKRLIINIPPRYGKTELAVKMYISWCLAKNPKARFIHLSYSDALALDNSSQTREYIQSDSYQRLWNMQLKKDSQSQKKWYTIQGGGVYATASGGAITGFGAGNGGAIIIDDPLKPDDAVSDVRRKFINNRYNTTIRSRVNDREVPIIVIMQRLHEDDLSGFLLDGNSGEQWYHLKLPAIDKNNKPLWSSKHSFKELESIRQQIDLHLVVNICKNQRQRRAVNGVKIGLILSIKPNCLAMYNGKCMLMVHILKTLETTQLEYKLVANQMIIYMCLKALISI